MQFLLAWLAVLLIGNLVAGLVVVADKRAAGRGRRRVAEKSFHLMAILGWWPGMVWAMRSARHKTQKRAFQVPFAAASFVGTLVAGGIAWLAWSMPQS